MLIVKDHKRFLAVMQHALETDSFDSLHDTLDKLRFKAKDPNDHTDRTRTYLTYPFGGLGRFAMGVDVKRLVRQDGETVEETISGFRHGAGLTRCPSTNEWGVST